MNVTVYLAVRKCENGHWYGTLNKICSIIYVYESRRVRFRNSKQVAVWKRFEEIQLKALTLVRWPSLDLKYKPHEYTNI